jgi:hypothetical protein
MALNALVYMSTPTSVGVRDLVEFVLTLVLCGFLYAGANTARWIAIVSLSPSGLAAILIGNHNIESAAGSLFVLVGCIYLACAIALMFPAASRAHFGRRKPPAV